MRGLILSLMLAGPVEAQQVPDPLQVIDDLTPYMQADDFDGIYAHLSAAVRAARAADALNGDWGIVFAMFADHVRNVEENPAYALRLAEEGLDLVAASGDPDPALTAVLNSSRAYALADLGRLPEAAETARLAAPSLRKVMGGKVADDLLANAQTWEGGALTEWNTAADTLALKVIERGFTAIDKGDYGQGLTLAAQASLPEDSGLPQQQVLRVNTLASLLRGRALYQLQRRPEALATLRTAADRLAPGWQGAQPAWALDPAEADLQVWQLFFWLARAAMDAEDFALAEQALNRCDSLPSSRQDQSSLSYLRMSLAQQQGDLAKAQTILRDAAVRARRADDLPGAALAEFYLARLQAETAHQWPDVDADALVTASEAALELGGKTGIIAPDFVMSEAAFFLVNTDRLDKGIDYARQALRLWQQQIATAATTDFEAAQDQRHTREIAEILLFGLNRAASRDPQAICNADEARGCVLLLGQP